MVELITYTTRLLCMLAITSLAACNPAQTSTPVAAGSAGLPLAAAPDYGQKTTIDGIPCGLTEVVNYHVHAHLAIFFNGQARPVPEGIGIAAPRHVDNGGGSPFVDGGSCFYWLHTHTNDGLIHIEAAAPQAFTLRQLFDIWQQPLSATQVGSAQGQVIAYVGGQRFSGDPGDIPLAPHALIQLDVGQDVPPQPYTFEGGL
ncbi:MAG: hypothetical protein EXR58_07965 [Chloroflexi bacterium]|nr:hypothetical protein [Chloroflexota bacterium]